LLLRKAAPIILLVILVFNMVGYRAWFYFAERQLDAAMETRLDKSQYDENDLISVTVPLDNPYQLDQPTFVRVDGEISFQGQTFKYVKCKVSNGNLILLCLPDAHKTVLKKAKTDYGNNLNDLTGNGKSSQRNNLQKNFNGNDYICQCANLPMCQCANDAAVKNGSPTIYFSDPHIAIPGKPPRFTA
jgi:hypothetical protein